MERKVLENLLSELFPEHEISDFSIEFILNNKATEESVRNVHQTLKRYGLEDEKIASQAQLLGFDPKTIRARYQSLLKLGIKPEKIETYTHLLELDPETIKAHYQHNVGLLRKDYKDRES
jgi:hypothetical protein